MLGSKQGKPESRTQRKKTKNLKFKRKYKGFSDSMSLMQPREGAAWKESIRKADQLRKRKELNRGWSQYSGATAG